MKMAKKLLLTIFSGWMFVNFSWAQTGCNIAQIDAAMSAAGFQELTVTGFPCAKYYYNPNTTNNWNTAQSQAAAVGATLLTVCSLAENDAVWNAAVAAGVTGGLWIGYNDINSEGTWVWPDGSTCGFTNWNGSEPSNTTDPCSFTGEDAAIIQMNNGRWNDVYASTSCLSQAYASLVKVNLCPQTTPSASSTVVCTGSSVQISGNTITGTSPYTYSWYNGPTQVGTGTPFSYTVNSTTTFTLVATDQYGCTDSENITITAQTCQSSSCDFTLLNNTMATAGFLPLNVSTVDFPCARYFYNNSATNNWNTAQSQCAAVGATLVSICSAAENTAVQNAAVAAGLTGGLWIGYTDQASEGNWVWADGSPCSYTNWNAGEPNNSNCAGSTAGEDGAIMQMSNGKWNDVYLTPTGFCLSPASYKSLIKVNVCPQTTPVVSIPSICQGSSTQLSATTTLGSTPYTYSWSPSASLSSGTGSPVTATPAATTIYTVVATDRFGCTDLETVSVTVNPTPTQPVINTSAAACSASGTAIIVNFTTGYTYTFSPAGPTVDAGGVISGLTVGTNYTVTASSGNCNSTPSASFSVSAPLTVPAIPTITTGPATCSLSGTATISNYVASPVSYIFSPSGPTAAAGGVISGLTPGISYTVTASNGSCSSSASVAFTVDAPIAPPATPTASVTIQPDCGLNPTGTIVVTAPNGADIQYSIGGTYQASGTFSGLSPNTYSVTAQNTTSGCVSLATTLTVNPPPGALSAPSAAVTTAPTCTAPTATVTVSSPVGPFEYSVDGGNTWQASPTFSGLAASTTVTFIVQDLGTNCVSTGTDVVIPAAPGAIATPTVSIDAPTCDVAGAATITNYVSTLTYSFTPSGPSVGLTGVVSNLTPGTSYTVAATDGSCNSLASQTFSVLAQFTTPDAPAITTLPATCSVPGSAGVTNYNGTLTYVFSPSGPSVSAPGVISGAIPGTSYTVTASNTSCTSSLSNTFTVEATLTAPATPDISVTAPTCTSDGSASITNYIATQTYTFSPAGPTAGAGGTIDGLTPGANYTVSASNGTCTSSASLTFTIGGQLSQPETPLVSVTTSDCTSDGSASITNYIATQTYTFSPAGPTVSSGGGINAAQPGTTYTVSASNGSCTSSASLVFSVEAQLSAPLVTVAPDVTSINEGATVTLTASGADNYIWTPTSGLSVSTGATVEAQPNETIEYCVIGSNSAGCTDTACALITVIVNCKELFIPNVFSPNENSLDDKFCLFGVNCIENMTLRIFNRWGELIFMNEDPNTCWDGYYKGELVMSGAYAYVLEATLSNGERIERKGSVQVIR
jgi:gliding motility-associated-like protein